MLKKRIIFHVIIELPTKVVLYKINSNKDKRFSNFVIRFLKSYYLEMQFYIKRNKSITK